MLELRRDEIAKFVPPWWKFGMIRAGIVALFYTCPQGHLNDLDPENVDKETGVTKTPVACKAHGVGGCPFKDIVRLVGWGGSVKIV